MEPEIIELLASYDSNILELDIRREKIVGILDLSRFVNLIQLDCSANYITSIINFPNTLETLFCIFNNINSLDNLPCSLEILNCSNNKIKNLEYLPNNLKKLIMEYNYVTELELLPSSIIELYCSGNKINKINIFPSLQKLTCGPYINNLHEIKNNFPNLIVKYFEYNSIYRFYDCF